MNEQTNYSAIERITGTYEDSSASVLEEPFRCTMHVLKGNDKGKDVFALEYNEASEGSTTLFSETPLLHNAAPATQIEAVHVRARTVMIQLCQRAIKESGKHPPFEGVKLKMTIEPVS